MTRHKELNKVKNRYTKFIGDFIYENYNQSSLTREENQTAWKNNYGYTNHLMNALMLQTRVFLRLMKKYSQDFTFRLIDFIADSLSPYAAQAETFANDQHSAKTHISKELKNFVFESEKHNKLINTVNAINGTQLKNAMTINLPLYFTSVREKANGKVKQRISLDKKQIVITYDNWTDFRKNSDSRVLIALQDLRNQEKAQKKQKNNTNKKQKLSPLAKTMRDIKRKKRELQDFDNKYGK